MPGSPVVKVVEHLRQTVLRREGDALSDGELLDRFLEKRDEVAFAALVRRHGPMVWGVCRRIAGQAADAEDAFQAAFLILVRKAAVVKPREAVGNWLYGVACHAALKARTASAMLHAKEKQVTSMPEPAKDRRDDLEMLQMLLDQALSSLPEKYRLPVVLCDLESRTRKEVAAQLKIPVGTLSSRLATGHQMLAKRMARHGLALAGGSLAALLVQNAASACVPASVVSSTIKTATIVAASNGAAASIVSAKVAALTEGVMKAMLISKLKIAATVLLVLSAVVLTLGAIAGQHQPALREDVKAKPQIKPSVPAQEDIKPAKAAQAAAETKTRTLLFSGGPMRDYQFVRSLFLREVKEKRMELSILLQTGEENTDINGARLLTEFPDRLGSDAFKKKGISLSDFDVVIAFDPDWSKLSKAQQVNLEKWVAEHKGGILFVAGPVHTFQLARPGNDFTLLQKLIPVVLKDARLVEIDPSRPHALKLDPKATIKLGPIGESPAAAWNRFFWDDEKFKQDPDKPQEPKRGFYACYPIEKQRPGAQTLAAFAGPKELRINDGKTDPPYLASMSYGKGKTMYLGSAETWRLRQYNPEYHERFWRGLVHDLRSIERASNR